MHRFAIDYLLRWSLNSDRKPMVIRGARQVGKSTLVRLMTKKAGFDLIELNLERNPKYADYFVDADIKQGLDYLAVDLKKEIVPGKSLLFLDEIQATPKMLQILRYFYEEMPKLHVVAAGSLLEFTLSNMSVSMPVGRVEYMHLEPMVFEEFLLALGEEKLVDFLNNFELSAKIPMPLHDKLLDYLKKYFIVGGMPEVVYKFSKSLSFSNIEEIKHNIINAYIDDFSKYANLEYRELLRKIFEAVPSIIGEKFKYSNVVREIRASTMSSYLERLCMARIIHKVFHTASNGVPLGAEINEKKFKAIFVDVGLVTSILGIDIFTLKEIKELAFVNKGPIAEQFIGQHLLCLQPFYKHANLYYWVREKKSAASEVDYVIQKNSRIIPIEVKAGTTGSLKSLQNFLIDKKCNFAVRFNMDIPSIVHAEICIPKTANKHNFFLLSLPLYLVGQLSRFLNIDS